MICKNCGAEIKNKESYCPSCGMELFVPYSKSLKEKYIAGEYQDHEENFIVRDRRNSPAEEEYYPEKDDGEQEQYHGDEKEEYNESGGGISVIAVIILFLIVALLIGFVIGILIFSGFLQSLPGFSNVTGF